MPKKLKGNIINSVKQTQIRTYLYMLIIILSSIFLIYLFIIKKFYIIALLTALAALGITVYMYKKAKILGAGSNGEKNAEKVLDKLPQNCTVISDVIIKYKNTQAQVDNIIITPNSIFVLEVKNYSGCLQGDFNNEMLTQVKYRDNKKEVKSVYNPIKQVQTHTRVIKNLLKDNGFNYNISYGVYFTNENFRVNIPKYDFNIYLQSQNDCDKLIKDICCHNNPRIPQKDIIHILLNKK